MDRAGSGGARLFSLDLLRGLDMMLLVVVYPFAQAAHKVWTLPAGVMRQLNHPQWVGFTVLDMVMPLFIFMCGAAIPFSLERRLDRNGGRPNMAYWRHVAVRFLVLWGLGLLVQGYVTTLDPKEILPYSNTLQTIAFGYLVAACLVVSKNMKMKICVTAALFAVYGVLLHCLGDYTQPKPGGTGGDFAVVCELAIMRFFYPDSAAAVRVVYNNCYSWCLTSMMFVVMTMCGYFATRILKSDWGEGKKLRVLALYSAGLLSCGGMLSIWVPVIKHTFTVSFTALAMGVSVALLAILYYLTDVLRFRRGLSICILFGQFSLTAYMCETFFRPVFVRFSELLLQPGVERMAGRYMPLVMAAACAVELVAVLLVRRRLKGG